MFASNVQKFHEILAALKNYLNNPEECLAFLTQLANNKLNLNKMPSLKETHWEYRFNIDCEQNTYYSGSDRKHCGVFIVKNNNQDEILYSDIHEDIGTAVSMLSKILPHLEKGGVAINNGDNVEGVDDFSPKAFFESALLSLILVAKYPDRYIYLSGNHEALDQKQIIKFLTNQLSANPRWPFERIKQAADLLSKIFNQQLPKTALSKRTGTVYFHGSCAKMPNGKIYEILEDKNMRSSKTQEILPWWGEGGVLDREEFKKYKEEAGFTRCGRGHDHIMGQVYKQNVKTPATMLKAQDGDVTTTYSSSYQGFQVILQNDATNDPGFKSNVKVEVTEPAASQSSSSSSSKAQQQIVFTPKHSTYALVEVNKATQLVALDTPPLACDLVKDYLRHYCPLSTSTPNEENIALKFAKIYYTAVEKKINSSTNADPLLRAKLQLVSDRLDASINQILLTATNAGKSNDENALFFSIKEILCAAADTYNDEIKTLAINVILTFYKTYYFPTLKDDNKLKIFVGLDLQHIPNAAKIWQDLNFKPATQTTPTSAISNNANNTLLAKAKEFAKFTALRSYELDTALKTFDTTGLPQEMIKKFNYWQGVPLKGNVIATKLLVEMLSALTKVKNLTPSDYADIETVENRTARYIYDIAQNLSGQNTTNWKSYFTPGRTALPQKNSFANALLAETIFSDSNNPVLAKKVLACDDAVPPSPYKYFILMEIAQAQGDQEGYDEYKRKTTALVTAKTIEQNDPVSNHVRALMLDYHDHNSAEAKKYYQAAADKNFGPALFQLATKTFKGLNYRPISALSPTEKGEMTAALAQLHDASEFGYFRAFAELAKHLSCASEEAATKTSSTSTSVTSISTSNNPDSNASAGEIVKAANSAIQYCCERFSVTFIAIQQQEKLQAAQQQSKTATATTTTATTQPTSPAVTPSTTAATTTTPAPTNAATVGGPSATLTGNPMSLFAAQPPTTQTPSTTQTAMQQNSHVQPASTAQPSVGL